jgi:hypothetical protein
MMGLIYLIAFSSLYVQIPGLWGHEGVMPVDAYLNRVAQHHGANKVGGCVISW